MITSVSKPPQQALLPVLGRWQSHERGWRALLEDNHGTDHVFLTGPADGADRRFIPAPGQHIDPVRPDAAWVRLAERVLEVVPDSNELLYARVDLVGARNGTVQLMEVELTEPQLFLAHSPPTTARLAQAIAARVTTCRPTTSLESNMTMARPGPRGKS